MKKYRITGQMSSGITGEHPHYTIEFIDVDTVVEARDEYEALEKMPPGGLELYICRDLEIQSLGNVTSSGLAV